MVIYPLSYAAFLSLFFLKPETLLPDGCGSMLYRDSCCHDGQWRNGMRHGTGVLTIPVGVLKGPAGEDGNQDGTVTVDGQWIDDFPCPDAEWNVTFPTGDKYLGNLKLPTWEDAAAAHTAGVNGQTRQLRKIVPHGWGLSKLKDTGEVYEGQWMDGMRHGQGVSHEPRRTVH